MNKSLTAELEALGRAAADQVAGHEAVDGVEVERGEDDRAGPFYEFSFLIDQSRTQQRVGLILTRLVQKLRDGLADRDDEHMPYVRLLNREDWDNRTSARSS